MNRKKYNLIQWTWGLPQNLIGGALYLLCRSGAASAPARAADADSGAAARKRASFNFSGARVVRWKSPKGMSLGKFIFIPEGRSAEQLLTHEYGHTIQSLVLGPLYLPLVGLPSLVWNNLPYFAKKRAKKGISYYSPAFEWTANSLGVFLKDEQSDVK